MSFIVKRPFNMGLNEINRIVDNRNKCRSAQEKYAFQRKADWRKVALRYATRMGITLGSFAATCNSVPLGSMTRAAPLPYVR